MKLKISVNLKEILAILTFVLALCAGTDEGLDTLVQLFEQLHALNVDVGHTHKTPSFLK